MARPKNAAIRDQREQEQLNWNLSAMKAAFSGKTISGKDLHLIKRYVEDRNKEQFQKNLKKDHPVLYDVLQSGVLPSSKTLAMHTNGSMNTPYKTVESLADFCTRAFSFQRVITAEDLLTKNLFPFPPLRRTPGLWGRYTGFYRCFYRNPDSKKDTSELFGALLQLKETEDGELRCRLIAKIQKDERFTELKEKMLCCSDREFEDEFERYKGSLPTYENGLIHYEGSVDLTLPAYFLLKLYWKDHNNSVLIPLRRWDHSAQPLYSGGMATAMFCRSEDIVCHGMVIVREEFSFLRDSELLQQQLSEATAADQGIRVSREMDKTLNQSLKEWSKPKNRK